MILPEEATITVQATIGEAACQKGLVLLKKPALKIASGEKEKSLLPPALDARLVTRYGNKSEDLSLGSYTKGTELVFELVPTSDMCSGNSYLSTDWHHARVSSVGTKCWRVAFEDYEDYDFNDVFLDVCYKPVPKLEAKPATPSAQQSETKYQLPWPANQRVYIMQIPGVGEHWGRMAYDFGGSGPVLASTSGTVLWVEDSFGPGKCDRNLYNSANVIVIQDDSGKANTVYLHLKGGSAKVRPGEKVTQGEKIAEMGNSGYVCPSDKGDGTHLHFEWQTTCKSLSEVQKVRGKVGVSNGNWWCTPINSTADFTFWVRGQKLAPTVHTWITSDTKIR